MSSREAHEERQEGGEELGFGKIHQPLTTEIFASRKARKATQRIRDAEVLGGGKGAIGANLELERKRHNGTEVYRDRVVGAALCLSLSLRSLRDPLPNPPDQAHICIDRGGRNPFIEWP